MRYAVETMLVGSRRFLCSALVSATLVTTAACSSTTKGNVSTTCPDDGGCQPMTVFATGVLSTVLVTSESVYAGDLAGNVYAADKPLRASRVLSKGTDATRNVAAFVRTGRGLYWFTSPPATSAQPQPKSALVWFPADGMDAVVLAADLARPLGIAAIGDVVYLAEPDGLFEVPAGESALRLALPVAAYGLRSHGQSLYFHDGLSKISSWRQGDAQPQVLVADASVSDLPTSSSASSLEYREDPFIVDDSGLYWMIQYGIGGSGTLAHAPLTGGAREATVHVASDYVKALSSDDRYVYWTQADSPFLPTKTTIHRATKSALASTDVVLGTLAGDATSVQALPEGLYVAASPSITDLDVKTLGFERYGGPLLIIPRAMIDAR